MTTTGEDVRERPVERGEADAAAAASLAWRRETRSKLWRYSRLRWDVAPAVAEAEAEEVEAAELAEAREAEEAAEEGVVTGEEGG